MECWSDVYQGVGQTERGVLIDNTGQPIGQQVIDLKKKISCLGSDKQGKEKKAELKQKLVELLENSRTLIELSGIILLFLEPPDRELLNLLKPILSHDKPEIEFPYVEKNSKRRICHQESCCKRLASMHFL